MSWDATTALGVNISGADITKSQSASWTNCIARTSDTLTFTSTETSIEMSFNSTDHSHVKLGIGRDPFNDGASKTWHDINYGFGDDMVIINGVNTTPDTSFSTTNTSTVKLVLNSSTNNITFYHNGTQIHQTTYPTGQTWYGIFAAYSTGQGASLDSINSVTSTPSTSGDFNNAHAHLKPLQVFRRQRDWF